MPSTSSTPVSPAKDIGAKKSFVKTISFDTDDEDDSDMSSVASHDERLASVATSGANAGVVRLPGHRTRTAITRTARETAAAAATSSPSSRSLSLSLSGDERAKETRRTTPRDSAVRAARRKASASSSSSSSSFSSSLSPVVKDASHTSAGARPPTRTKVNVVAVAGVSASSTTSPTPTRGSIPPAAAPVLQPASAVSAANVAAASQSLPSAAPSTAPMPSAPVRSVHTDPSASWTAIRKWQQPDATATPSPPATPSVSAATGTAPTDSTSLQRRCSSGSHRRYNRICADAGAKAVAVSVPLDDMTEERHRRCISHTAADSGRFPPPRVGGRKLNKEEDPPQQLSVATLARIPTAIARTTITTKAMTNARMVAADAPANATSMDRMCLRISRIGSAAFANPHTPTRRRTPSRSITNTTSPTSTNKTTSTAASTPPHGSSYASTTVATEAVADADAERAAGGDATYAPCASHQRRTAAMTAFQRELAATVVLHNDGLDADTTSTTLAALTSAVGNKGSNRGSWRDTWTMHGGETYPATAPIFGVKAGAVGDWLLGRRWSTGHGGGASGQTAVLGTNRLAAPTLVMRGPDGL